MAEKAPFSGLPLVDVSFDNLIFATFERDL
jgi:hypothetical protein